MSPVRFERTEVSPGYPKRTTITEHNREFPIGFTDVKQALGLSSQELRDLSEQLNVPKQPRIRGPAGTIYYYSDEHLLRMALRTGKVEVVRDETTGLTNLVGENAITTLSISHERIEEFRK